MILYSQQKFKGNVLTFELIAPGHKKEDFSVEMEQHYFTIENEKEGYKETYKLPYHFKTNEVTAEYDAGILRLEFKTKKPKKVKIL